jgi:hypothetical protein
VRERAREGEKEKDKVREINKQAARAPVEPSTNCDIMNIEVQKGPGCLHENERAAIVGRSLFHFSPPFAALPHATHTHTK